MTQPRKNPACGGIFSGSSHTGDLKIGTPVATLPGAWRYRVSTGTGRPGVSTLWLGEVERLICNFYLSVAARKNCLSRSVPEIHWHVAGTLSNQPTNKQTPGPEKPQWLPTMLTDRFLVFDERFIFVAFMVQIGAHRSTISSFLGIAIPVLDHSGKIGT